MGEMCYADFRGDRTVVKMIDRSLNYGRHRIKEFLACAGEFRSVLDIGAGHGDDLILAKEINPRTALYAIEGDPQYAQELAEKNMIVHGLNIEKDPLPFTACSIDVVIVNQVLEHTKEIFWIFHEITRVLTPGGNLIVGVPNLASLHNRILLALGVQPTPIKSNSAHVDLRGELLPRWFQTLQLRREQFLSVSTTSCKPVSAAFPDHGLGHILPFSEG